MKTFRITLTTDFNNTKHCRHCAETLMDAAKLCGYPMDRIISISEIDDSFKPFIVTDDLKINIDSPKSILRQHLHGMSDEQFEIEINKFPLSEVLFAMERYAKIAVDGSIKVIKN